MVHLFWKPKLGRGESWVGAGASSTVSENRPQGPVRGGAEDDFLGGVFTTAVQ